MASYITQLDDPQTLYLVSMIKHGRSDVLLSEEDREELKQITREYREFIDRDMRHYNSMIKIVRELRKEMMSKLTEDL